MKFGLYLTVLTIVFSVGCSPAKYQVNGPCNVAHTAAGATISCPDGSSTTVSNGTTGQTGATGATGQTGATGANGLSMVYETITAPAGSCGYNPDSSAVAGTVIMLAQDTQQTGAWSSADADQTSVLVCNGSVGNIGATGATGAQGSQGVPGTNGASLSVIQFCADYTVSYPTTFPEYGIVINSSIYAVYWNGKSSWLTEVPPGTYKSTSTSAPCNFTVNPDGTVADN